MIHKDLLFRLLPPLIFDQQAPNLGAKLLAVGNALDATKSNADLLLLEFDPRITSQMLEDWERCYGLPLPCMRDLSLTVAQRQAVLTHQVTSVGDMTPAYYIQLAASIGYSITIVERARGPYTWDVHLASLPNYSHRHHGQRFGYPFAIWGEARLECMIRRFRPAHTDVIFIYGA